MIWKKIILKYAALNAERLSIDLDGDIITFMGRRYAVNILNGIVYKTSLDLPKSNTSGMMRDLICIHTLFKKEYSSKKTAIVKVFGKLYYVNLEWWQVVKLEERN